MRATTAGMELLARSSIGELVMRPHSRLPPDAPLWQVVHEMRLKGRGCVLIEDQGELVGVFTERDLLSRVDHGDPAWSQRKVSDVMTPHPMVSRHSDSLSEAVRLLTEGRRRHLPVVDDRGQVVGLLSIRDILAYVASKFPDDMLNLPPDPDHEA